MKEYATRLSVQEALLADLSRREERIATARLLAAVLIIAVVVANLTVHLLVLWWALPPLLVFAWLIGRHAAMRRERARAARLATFYRRGIDRINDRWMGAGETGERFSDAHHVYAADLDLFGRGSLFELLSAARTRMGEQTLARWLLEPAAPDEIRERQDCLSDLRGRLDLREDLDGAGDVGVGVRPDALLSWSESANQLQAPWIRPVTIALPVLALLTVLVWALTGVYWPFLAVLLAEIAVVRVLSRPLKGVAESAEASFDNLSLLSALLKRVERESFSAPALQALQRRLTSRAQTASHVIARLRMITDLSGHRRNLLVQLFFELPLLYSVNVALAAEAWRSRHGAAVREWLSTIGRLEALSSLAMYAYEHPYDPFPTLVQGAATFEAREIGHPLLPTAACVRNDVGIRAPVRTLLVSGSNMSGKSTLLRAVGVNIVLAMAGAPVRAAALMLTPLHVGASIRVNDSLNQGHSRFYAEITRLRQLYEISGRGTALLFLLDELLQGTNSKDRRVGAEGVLREFIKQGAIGLISTHDLALTEISGSHPDALLNVHFEDFFADDRITFDFKLRDGIVTKSNGIELMRSIGLKV